MSPLGLVVLLVSLSVVANAVAGIDWSHYAAGLRASYDRRPALKPKGFPPHRSIESTENADAVVVLSGCSVARDRGFGGLSMGEATDRLFAGVDLSRKHLILFTGGQYPWADLHQGEQLAKRAISMGVGTHGSC